VRGQYILRGHEPVLEEDLLTWGRWFEENDRHVRLTRVGPYTVSTVFLGLDHSFARHGPPILFETMCWIDLPQDHGVFKSGRTMLDECERCSTWDEAEAQHDAMIAKLREPGDAVEELTDSRRDAKAQSEP
jgi:hypothetical protein